MSVASSTMKCPVCPDQMLEILSAPIGNFERCPNCHGLFITQDIVAAASQDRSQCLQALEEPKALLLPTDKWCPKCMQKLFDGRVRSRGVILTLCATCQALWTDLSILRQFEEAVERTLVIQIDIANNPQETRGASGNPVSSGFAHGATVSDSGLGHFFRAFARFFDRWADRISGPASLEPPKKTTSVKKPIKTEKSPKKSLILEVEPTAPAPNLAQSEPAVAKLETPAAESFKEVRKEPEPVIAPPSIEIPEFIFPEESGVEESAAQEPARILESPPEEKPQAIPETKPDVVFIPEPPVVPEPEPIPVPPAALSQPEKVPEALPKPEPVVPVAAELRHPITEEPKPLAAKPLKPKPIEKKPPMKEGPGFFAKFKAAWTRAPKKPSKVITSVEPIAPQAQPLPPPPTSTTLVPSSAPAPVNVPETKPVEKKPIILPQPKSVSRGFFDFLKPKPKTKPAPKPLSKPSPKAESVPVEPKLGVATPEILKSALESKPVKPAKIKGEGFIAKFFSPKKKPAGKPPESIPPSEIPAAKPEAPKPSEFEEKPAPVAEKPLPVSKKVAPAPMPKRVKTPKDPMDHLAVWPPWVLALLAVTCSAFRDFGFEAGPAALWGIAGWSIGMMGRLARLYPFQSFQESTLKELSDKNASSGVRCIPVILIGQIVLADEQNPKGEVVFQQEEKTLRLNRIGRWDLIPRFFGLSNPRQLIKGDVTLKGWYRSGLSPWLELLEVRAEKTSRKSMVRSMRWAFAVTLLVLALVACLALE